MPSYGGMRMIPTQDPSPDFASLASAGSGADMSSRASLRPDCFP